VLAATLLLFVLCGTWFVVRCGGSEHEPSAARDSTRGELWLGASLVLLAAFPLLSLAPWVHGPANAFWGDSPTHARVADDMATLGLPHGWLDSYAGGFPFAHHYPQLGWLLTAAAIRLGLSAGEATHLVGWSATLATPLLIYFFSVRLGSRPRFAFVGATLVLWVSPYNPFVGGYETFFSTGLLSQSVGLPACLWLASSALPGSRRWEAPVAAILAMAGHPQVATATLTVLGVGALASANAAAIRGFFRALLFAVIAGAALYGQGIATLKIPLGWPPGLGWRQLGFLPSRLTYWVFDGDLLDRGRAPVASALTAASLGGLFVNFKHPLARGLGVSFIVGIVLSVSGRLLFDLGAIGRVLLTFLQPLRLSALLPILSALVVVTLLQLAAVKLEGAFTAVNRAPWAGRVSPALLLGALGLLSFGLPSRVDDAKELWEQLRTSNTSCGRGYPTPAGYDRNRVASWLRELTDGKLWYDVYGDVPARDCLACCVNRHGLDLASPVAIASVGGVGGHVGTLTHAAGFLSPTRPGFARRAEALGVSYWLFAGDERSVEGWTTRHVLGRVRLMERPRGTHRVGLGCIRERYLGSDRSLRKRLHAELETEAGADKLLNPNSFVELAPGSDEFRSERVTNEDCDSERASVRVTADTPGLIEAFVTNDAPVDVVFRATAFPLWRVADGGSEVSAVRKVAPGYFSVRLEPGRHALRAVVSPMPHYLTFLLLGLLLIGALGFVRVEHLVAVFERTRRKSTVRSRLR